MNDAATAHHLEDFVVGQMFRGGPLTITRDAILRFATEFDPQPFHTDDVAARDSFFKGLAASGWHTAALTMRMLVDGELRLAGGVIGAGAELSWPQATRPDDVLRTETTVTAVAPSRSRPDRGIVTLHTLTYNQRDEVVQDFTAKVVAWRRPAA